MAHGNIIDPAGRSAGFHDDEVDLVLFEDSLEVTPLGSSVVEGMNPSFLCQRSSTWYCLSYLTGPRSRARVFIVSCPLGLGLE